MYILTDIETGRPLDKNGEFSKHIDDTPRFETREQAALFAAHNWIEYFLIQNIFKEESQ